MAATGVDGVEVGAPAPVFAKGRDLGAAAAVLGPWLADRLGVAQVEIGDFSYPAGAGVSNETILFTAHWSSGGVRSSRDLVLRVHPAPEYQLFLDPEFRMQFDLLAALHRAGDVRVAEPFWYSDDDSLLGRPFFVMERLHGQVPVSMPVYNSAGWLTEASPAERRRLWLSAMDQLAAIHRTPVATVAFLDRPQWAATGVEQQLSYWDRCLHWTLDGAIPDVMHEVRAWLAANLPSQLEPGLSWGDARVGNMMFGADFTVAGVMDWEQASLGGPMQDVGWWLFFDDYHSTDHGLPRLDGLGGRQETIDLWQELTGLVVHDLRWHEVFAGYKLATLMFRTLALRYTESILKAPVRHLFLARACDIAGIDLPAPYR